MKAAVVCCVVYYVHYDRFMYIMINTYINELVKEVILCGRLCESQKAIDLPLSCSYLFLLLLTCSSVI